MVTAFLVLVPVVPYVVLGLSGHVSRSPLPSLLPAVQPEPAHPCGNPEEAPPAGGGPFSARAVREAARGWEWKNLETPGWKLLLTPGFAIRGDVPIGDLRTVGVYLEEFRREARGVLGGDDRDLTFSARAFADVREFRRYAARAGAANAESFYDPRSAELVLCLEGPRDGVWLQRTVAHEFAHEYMDRVWKRTGPLWFAEGVAEYFSNFAVRNGRVEPGAVNSRALLLLRMEEPMALEQFFKLPRDEMYGVGFARHYAQAWSFVHYLFSRGDGLIDLLLRGGELPDVGALEQGWMEHLKRLEQEP